jgi:hypothetical protein
LHRRCYKCHIRTSTINASVNNDRVITITSINNTLVVNDASASDYVVTITSINGVEVLKGTVRKACIGSDRVVTLS